VTCHLKTNRDLGVLQQAELDENIKKIRDAIMFDRRRTIDELEALTGVSWSACQRILTEESPELWRSGGWLLHPDNAPAHTALSVRQFLAKNGMITASHPPLLPGPDTLRFFPISKNEEGP